MSSIFCCSSCEPYRPAQLLHDAKFKSFIAWAKRSKSSLSPDSASFFQDPAKLPLYAVQFVQQVNYGTLESKRYFIPLNSNNNVDFVEVKEGDLIAGNFEKLNSYKNFKCIPHNKFFEVNLYQEDPVNHHHWRSNIARPAEDIDL